MLIRLERKEAVPRHLSYDVLAPPHVHYSSIPLSHSLSDAPFLAASKTLTCFTPISNSACVQVLAAAYSALSSRGLTADPRAEKQLVALLTLPLAKYDVVTGLGLTEYPLLMSLLRHRTHKELATRIIG